MLSENRKSANESTSNPIQYILSQLSHVCQWPLTEYLYLKAENRKYFINLDPRCEFPGGNGKLKEWIDENIRISEGFKGSERVVVSFTVHPDGSISDATIVRRPSKNEAVNQEALRLVNALPKFRVKYYTPQKKNLSNLLPITFKEHGAIFIRGDESR